MTGSKRRAFQAAMTVKYCCGSARQAETVFGWSRQAVTLGLHERRTGIICLSAQPLVGGAPLWEEMHPEAAAILWELAEAHAQWRICFEWRDGDAWEVEIVDKATPENNAPGLRGYRLNDHVVLG